ncbi:MAG: TlyA family RNA methyltransferase, partial [Berryella intestinalis]|nr:TlyA family RNA methyltransferase [Berryella intestinalis]
VVRDEAVRARTVDEVREALVDAGFEVTGVIESPIKGAAAGNVEYLVRAVRRG